MSEFSNDDVLKNKYIGSKRVQILVS